MINQMIVMGRLTYEPELKSTVNGTAFVNIQIACDRDYISSDKKRHADFIDCQAWNKTAEFIHQYFHKGDMIAVTGRLRTDNYTDNDGYSRKAVLVRIENVSFCGSKPKERNYEDADFEEIPDYDEPC